MFSENWLEKHGNASFQDFWTVLCRTDKKDLLMEYISKIKSVAGEILWLPFVTQSTA